MIGSPTFTMSEVATAVVSAACIAWTFKGGGNAPVGSNSVMSACLGPLEKLTAGADIFCADKVASSAAADPACGGSKVVCGGAWGNIPVACGGNLKPLLCDAINC